jgi:class 3 adenylate cyclase
MPAEAFHVVGLFTTGLGVIFFLTDRHGRASRALSLCFAALGVRLLLAPVQEGLTAPLALEAVGRTLEALSMLAGIEWARRVAATVRTGLRRAARGVLLAAQILVLIYGGLTLGYLVVAPELAMQEPGGFFRLRAIEWAVFAPVLGSGLLLAGIGFLLIMFSRGDPAEAIRLRALLLAAPFLFAALLVPTALVPLCISVGLLIFLFGAVRYLQVLTRRGQLMSQFLAPQVARLMHSQGEAEVLQRERRPVTALFCDLRGFTAYGQQHDSAAVTALLERFYALVGQAAETEGATVKDHAGDGVLLLCGAPLRQRDHADRAVRLALRLRETLSPLLIPEGLGLGIGIASGEVTVGAIQGAGRLEYVAVGEAINLASRLCGEAAAGQILLAESTRTVLGDNPAVSPEPCTPLHLKGVAGAVAVSVL